VKASVNEFKVTREQRREMAARVRAALERHQPRNYRLIVEDETLTKDDAGWMLVVRPDGDEVPLGDSVDRCMVAEDEMRRLWNVEISLLPLIPPEDD
jgi:hypothetical protein